MARFSDALKKRGGDLASAVTKQNGMPISLSSTFEGGFSIGILDYYTQLAAAMQQDDIRPSQMGRETLVSRAPIGVVAAIVPWNFPVVLSMMKIGPALATGCTLVIKPSPGTVLDSYIIAEAALEAGIPAGVLNWVAADRAVGAYLVSHPGVDKVSFTGSTAAGRSIARTCGEMLRPVTLELGGKSAAIVLDDANIDAVIQGLQQASLDEQRAGLHQLHPHPCAAKPLWPVRRRAGVDDQFAQGRQRPGARPLRSGRWLRRRIATGSKVTSPRARTEAKLVAGGGRPKNTDGGWFVQPTVFADVANTATIAQEEIFGPVVVVIPYKDDAEAIRIANDSAYGLGGSVWSSDEQRARGVARRVQTGSIGINGYIPSIGSPFGGVKASGLGREFGPEALGSYQQWKSIYVMG